MRPGRQTHLPTGSSLFRLSGDPGQEILYVVVSTHTLSQPLILKEIEGAGPEAISRDPDDEPPPPPPPPDRCDKGGCFRGYDKLRRLLWGRMDDRGIAVLRFPLRIK